MRIERVDLLHVRMELLHPFETSSHRKDHLDHVLVKLSSEGLVGWGESAVPTDPYYCPETTETALHVLRDYFVPAVLGQDLETPEQVLARCARVRGHNFARAGLEMAFWALLAERERRPLHALLGGTRAEILSGVSLGIEPSLGALFGRIERFLEEGYRRVKLKIKPGWDIEVVRAVRERYPDLPLMVDANSAYTLDDLDHLAQLDAFDLLMIEQPLGYDDIVDHAKLQARIKTPVCLDESIHSVDDARKALELGSARVINIKTSRLGGLLNAKRVHDLCLARGVPVWCGGMHEYGIGRAANVAIASLPGFTIPGDVSGSDKYYAEDLVDPPILAHRGAIPVPQRPGLGYAVNEERVRRFTVRGWSRAAGADDWRAIGA